MAQNSRRTIAAIVRSDQGGELKIRRGETLQEFAIRWSYLIRNRSHWSNTDVSKMTERLRHEIRQRWGFSDEELRPFTNANLIEVEVPFVSESDNWEARILPWEFVLTRIFPRTQGRVPIVVRRLHIKSGEIRHPIDRNLADLDWKRPLLYVEAAPGKLGREYSFARERRLVSQSLANAPWKRSPIELFDPTLADIKNYTSKAKPLVVHIAGVDNHQGAELLSEQDSRFNDGMYLRSTSRKPHKRQFERTTKTVSRELAGQPLQVTAFELAAAVGPAQPALVGLNLYHSAPRIAPLLLAHGAQRVVSFQDTIEDVLAEIFFAEFYSKWVSNDAQAFQESLMQIMAGGTPMAGAGIVLWSSSSLLPVSPRSRGKSEADCIPTPRSANLETFQPTADFGSDWEKHLGITIEPHQNINYSLLHNGRSLFKQFYLHNRTGKRLDGLQIRLLLSLGDQCLEQTKRFSMSGAGLDLRNELPLSLLSSQLRRFKEAVGTTLKISIDWHGQMVWDQNYMLRILPINEWSDTDDERHWLPSFVQPRDVAVTKIKERAKLWLKRLTSDYTAGFDGYQQVNDRNAESWIAVTHQVEAIWDALAYDCSLVYTNPPPTYTVNSQRVRTPSEVLESRTGTCLDLALLLAACLEEIDVYPVIFLLQGHAFPGYWQTANAQIQFWGNWEAAVAEKFESNSRVSARGRMDAHDHQHQWMLNKLGFTHMLNAVHRGHLIPIESVWLTSEQKLGDAIQAGGENLIDRREFECLIDIVRARQKKVLPLPEIN